MQFYAYIELYFCEMTLSKVFPLLVTRINLLFNIRTFALRKLRPITLNLSKTWCTDVETSPHMSCTLYKRCSFFITPIKNWQLCQLLCDKHKRHLGISDYTKAILCVKPSNYELLFPKVQSCSSIYESPRVPSHSLLKNMLNWKDLRQ